MKKILIITYYWPPAGGSGVQRWLKFVKFLPEFDFLPTVLTTKNGDYQVLDESLLSEIPENVKIIRTKTPAFYGLIGKLLGKKSEIPYGTMKMEKQDSAVKKILLWIRLNLIIPDARIIWNKYALKAAKRELKNSEYDFVITTGPPHSTHLIGDKLKQKFSLEWIADFRDPWTTMGYLKSAERMKLTLFFDKMLERKIVRNCDKLTAVSKKIIADLGNKDKMFLLRNGFDEDDFKNINSDKKTDYFQINYFGTMTLDSNPLIVLKAVYELRKRGINNIRLNFWGNIDEDVKKILKANDPENIVNFHSYIVHKQVLHLMKQSHLLLLVINDVKNNEGIITGKIFEYIGSEIPILGIGPTQSEPAEILAESGCGKMFDYENRKGIINYITTVYHNYQENKNLFDKKNIRKFSRKNLTQQLAEILNSD